jgi:hypothetical protein
MNNKSTAIISTIFILFVLVRNIMETSKTTWNYLMIVISIALLAYNGYQFYQSRR